MLIFHQQEGEQDGNKAYQPLQLLSKKRNNRILPFFYL